eukprot:6301183-Ditylum_brightwellii.AAC.1
MKTAPISTQNNPDVKRAYHTYKLRTTPADDMSPIYKISVWFFNNGTPKEWIKFRRRLQAVLKGQNVMQGPPSYAVAKTLFKGDALMFFKQAEINQEYVFPKKAGQTQKCYM